MKKIEELHTNNNKSCRELSLHNIVNTSLEAAYTWALCQTFHMINTLKSNISNASTTSSSSSPSSYAKYNASSSQHKTSIVQECILNAVNLKIIQTYSKNTTTTTNNNELNQPSLPYWLLAWLQCGVYMDETMNATRNNSSSSTDADDNGGGVDDNQLPTSTTCQHSIYWKRVTPIICLYEDELITAGNQLVSQSNRSVQSTSPRKESGVLLPAVKQVLQKILVS
ncbi:unnamed protein product [Trichobilharzia regenti]|nr:unnamed protein product [Trichobilharzia regenti]